MKKAVKQIDKFYILKMTILNFEPLCNGVTTYSKCAVPNQKPRKNKMVCF